MNEYTYWTLLDVAIVAGSVCGTAATHGECMQFNRSQRFVGSRSERPLVESNRVGPATCTVSHQRGAPLAPNCRGPVADRCTGTAHHRHPMRRVRRYRAATPLTFSTVRKPPNPNIPIRIGSISVMSAGYSARLQPATASATLTTGNAIQFQAQAAPHTHPIAGRHPATNTDGPKASAWLISSCT
jgi:hypothetical protein